MIRLKDVLAVGQKADVGLDVFWGEPPDPDDPIFSDNMMVKNDKRQI
jgi:phosphoglycerate dehydrogenase-like enzyme